MKQLNNLAEKHYKKFIVGGSLTILTSLFVLMLIVKTDTVTAGTLSWKDDAITKANMDIAITGQETVDELLAKDLNITTESDIERYIREQEALLEKLLREYYEAKVSGLTSEFDLSALKKQIDNIRANLLIEYKRQIDVAFVDYQK